MNKFKYNFFYALCALNLLAALYYAYFDNYSHATFNLLLGYMIFDLMRSKP